MEGVGEPVHRVKQRQIVDVEFIEDSAPVSLSLVQVRADDSETFLVRNELIQTQW